MLDNLLPEGFKDEVSHLASIEHKYLNKIISLFQNNGYELVKTPLIEYCDNIHHGNSFKIKVKKKQRELALRDDITMQISRISSSRFSKKQRPLKICYYGEVVRTEGSILRPERQFLQIGAECIGDKSYLADVEMLELAYDALKSVGIKNISIELSSRIFIDQIYKKNSNSAKINQIKSLIRKKDLNNALKFLDKKFHKDLKNIFSCTGNFLSKQRNLKELKTSSNNIKEINNLINIHRYFLKKNPGINFFLDLCEIDEKNYHDGIRFTIFAENVRGEIAKGGRYTSLNKNVSENSTGFTCYMDTIIRASSKLEKSKKILVPFNLSNRKKNELLSKKFIVETYYGNKRNIKKIATNKKCHSCLIGNKIVRIKK